MTRTRGCLAVARHWGPIAVATILITGCAASKKKVQIPDPTPLAATPRVEIEHRALRAGAGGVEGLGVDEISVPGEITEVAIDPTGTRVDVLYRVGGESGTTHVRVDPTSSSVVPVAFYPEQSWNQHFGARAVSSRPAVVSLLVTAAGESLRTRAPVAFVTLPRADEALLIGGEPTRSRGKRSAKPASSKKNTISMWDRSSGRQIWSRDWKGSGAPAQASTWLDGENLFLVKGGLFWADRASGQGQYYQASTSDVSVAKAAAASCLWGVLAALSPAPTVAGPNVSADVTDGLFSNPLVVENRVYFADEKNLVCLNLEDAQKIWSSELEGRAGCGGLLRMGDRHGVLVRFGRDRYNGQWRATKNASVTCFDLASGQQVWQYVPEDGAMVEEAASGTNAVALSIAGRIVVIDATGDVLTDRGGLQEWLSGNHDLTFRGDRMIAVKDSTIEAWDLGANALAWRVDKDLEIHAADLSDAPWVAYNDPLERGGWWTANRLQSDAERVWLVPASGGPGSTITAMSRRDGTTRASFAYDFERCVVFENHLALIAGNHVAVVALGDLLREVLP